MAEFDWERFWCRPSDAIALTDDGYLVAPGADPQLSRNPHARTLASLADMPCLALIGELGLGKSTELRRLMGAPTAGNEALLHVPLGDYREEEQAHREIFDDWRFRAWAAGEGVLTLFLDGLDEALSTNPRLIGQLAHQFAKYDLTRLRLRITCRAESWSQEIAQSLQLLWGKGAAVYELLPLRREDIALAARQRSLSDAESFLDEIARHSFGSLAARPLTLDMLLNIATEGQAFPDTAAAVFEKGCKLLCGEERLARREDPQRSVLEPTSRLAIAARIAVIAVLGGRTAIWAAPDVGAVPQGDATIDDLAGGEERVPTGAVPVDRTTLRETLQTGLFSSRGENRLGWAHEAYGQYLAARRLRARALPFDQLRKLLTLDDGVIVPQLRGVAAWLAADDRDVFALLLEHDPAALLSADLPACPEPERADLVAALCRTACDNPAWTWQRAAWQPLLWKLRHPGLSEQLRLFVDAGADRRVRAFAMEIVAACHVVDLAGVLADIALSDEDDLATRQAAVRALIALDDQAARERLQPLALSTVSSDTHDELKGLLLRATWPRGLTTTELFQVLTPPRSSRRIIGTYTLFLAYDVVPRLQPADLLGALAWAGRYPERQPRMLGMARLVDAILRLAWEHIDDTSVATGFAAVALARLRRYESILPDPAESFSGAARPGALSFAAMLASDTARRRALVAAIVPLLDEGRHEEHVLTMRGPALVVPEDLPWLLERLRATPVGPDASRLARLVELVFRATNPDHVAALDAARAALPAFAGEFSWFENTVRREPMAMPGGDDGDPRDGPSIAPPRSPLEQLTIALDVAESATSAGVIEDAWEEIIAIITRRLQGSGGWVEGRGNVQGPEQVQLLEPTIRARVVMAATRALRATVPDATAILEHSQYSGSDLATAKGLRVLLHAGEDALAALPAATWHAWLPLILTPFAATEQERADWLALNARAYCADSDGYLAALARAVAGQDRRFCRVALVNTLPADWDAPLAATVLGFASDASLQPDSRAALLGALLRRQVAGAREVAEAILAARGQRPAALAQAVALAEVLADQAVDIGWPLLRSAVRDDPAFGWLALDAILSRIGAEDALLGALVDEADHAELYTWLARDCPPDPRDDTNTEVLEGSGVARMHAEQLRSEVATRLAAFGTSEAVAEFAALEVRWPDDGLIRGMRVRAEAAERRQRWSPLAPSDVIKLLDSREDVQVTAPSANSRVRAAAPTIGIITALPHEYAAMAALLDHTVDIVERDDPYLLGEVPAPDDGRHVVVLELLAETGNNSAALRGALLLDRFDTVKRLLMVGIAGGVPNPRRAADHVRLGDVVVCDRGGVIQYDFIRDEGETFRVQSAPRPPAASLLRGVRHLEVAQLQGRRPWEAHLDAAIAELHFSRPPADTDVLLAATGEGEIEPHPDDPLRPEGRPQIFRGPIASANVLLKNPVRRDAFIATVQKATIGKTTPPRWLQHIRALCWRSCRWRRGSGKGF